MTTTTDSRGCEAPATTDTTADYGVLRWLVLATFVVILNETIMVNAIPSLMGEFSVTARSAQWLSTGFMLTMAVVIPVTENSPISLGMAFTMIVSLRITTKVASTSPVSYTHLTLPTN